MSASEPLTPPPSSSLPETPAPDSSSTTPSTRSSAWRSRFQAALSSQSSSSSSADASSVKATSNFSNPFLPPSSQRSPLPKQQLLSSRQGLGSSSKQQSSASETSSLETSTSPSTSSLESTPSSTLPSPPIQKPLPSVTPSFKAEASLDQDRFSSFPPLPARPKFKPEIPLEQEQERFDEDDDSPAPTRVKLIEASEADEQKQPETSFLEYASTRVSQYVRNLAYELTGFDAKKVKQQTKEFGEQTNKYA